MQLTSEYSETEMANSPEVLVINAEVELKLALYTYLNKGFRWSAYSRPRSKEPKFQLAGKMAENRETNKPFGVILYDVGSQDDSTWKSPPAWFLNDIWEPAHKPPIVLLVPKDSWQDISSAYTTALGRKVKRPIVVPLFRQTNEWGLAGITPDNKVREAWEAWENNEGAFEDIYCKTIVEQKKLQRNIDLIGLKEILKDAIALLAIDLTKAYAIEREHTICKTSDIVTIAVHDIGPKVNIKMREIQHYLDKLRHKHELAEGIFTSINDYLINFTMRCDIEIFSAFSKWRMIKNDLDDLLQRLFDD